MNIKLVIHIIFLSTFITYSLFAIDLEVDIFNSKYRPVSILFSKTIDDNIDDNKLCKNYSNDIINIVKQDLENSGAFLVNISNDGNIIFNKEISNFEISSIPYDNYDILVSSKCIYNEEKMDYKFALVIFNKDNEIILNTKYKVSLQKIDKYNLEYVSHLISNDIYKNLLGIDGYFASSLIYVENEKNLMISDYTGNNAVKIVDSKGKIYGPSLSSNNRYLAYVELIKGVSIIYLYDFDYKSSVKLGEFDGLSLSPRFSKDNNFLLFSIANNGKTNIIEINLSTKNYSTITNDNNINLAGGYSYDDSMIVFNSDKAKNPHIYLFEKNTKKIKKISKNSGSYYNPSFAYNINVVLFTKIYNKKFYIGLLSLDGEEKIVSDINEDFAESPSWVYDDRHIIYQFVYKINNKEKLYKFCILDIISGKKFFISPSKNVMDPIVSKLYLNSFNNMVQKIQYY